MSHSYVPTTLSFNRTSASHVCISGGHLKPNSNRLGKQSPTNKSTSSINFPTFYISISHNIHETLQDQNMVKHFLNGAQASQSLSQFPSAHNVMQSRRCKDEHFPSLLAVLCSFPCKAHVWVCLYSCGWFCLLILKALARSDCPLQVTFPEFRKSRRTLNKGFG